jgi:hypothetical protein
MIMVSKFLCFFFWVVSHLESVIDENVVFWARNYIYLNNNERSNKLCDLTVDEATPQIHAT